MAQQRDDRANLGLSEVTYQLCVRLKEEGVFRELLDVYRLGIALAIKEGKALPEVSRQRNMFNFGSLDPDGVIKDVITELYPDQADRPYAFAERLAEYGVSEIGRLHESGQLRFREVLAQDGGQQPEDGGAVAVDADPPEHLGATQGSS